MVFKLHAVLPRTLVGDNDGGLSVIRRIVLLAYHITFPVPISPVHQL